MTIKTIIQREGPSGRLQKCNDHQLGFRNGMIINREGAKK